MKELKIIRPVVSLKGKFPERIVDFGLSVTGFKYHLPDTFFTVTLDEAEFQWKDSTLRLVNFAYSSPIPKAEFAGIHPEHKNWEDFFAKEMLLEKFTIRSLLNQKTLFADRLIVRNAIYQTFENKKHPREPKQSTLFSQKLRELPYRVKIDQVSIIASAVRYDELGPERIEPGVLTFNNLSLKASNVTNILSEPGQKNVFDIQAKLLDAGKLDVQLVLPLDSALQYATLKGELGPMPLIVLNPVLSPLELIRINSGMTQGMEFEMKIGEERASVDLKFLYQDLSISLYSFDEDHQRTHINLLHSFFVKGIVKKSNPLHPGDKIWEHAEYERNPYRSIFNYIWKTLLAGLTESFKSPNEALIDFATKKQSKS